MIFVWQNCHQAFNAIIVQYWVLFQMPSIKWSSCMMGHSFTSFWRKSRSTSVAPAEHRVTSTCLQKDTQIFAVWLWHCSIEMSSYMEHTAWDWTRNIPWQQQGTAILHFGVGSSDNSCSLQGIALEGSSQAQRLQLHPLQLHNHMLITLLLGLNSVKD